MGIEIIDDFKTKERLLREDFLYRGETRTPLTEQTGTWGLTGKESDVLDFQEQRTLTPLVPACPLGILFISPCLYAHARDSRISIASHAHAISEFPPYPYARARAWA